MEKKNEKDLIADKTNDVIRDLRRSNAGLKGAIEVKKKALAEAELTIQALRNEVKKRDEVIQSLQSKVQTLTSVIEEDRKRPWWKRIFG